VSELDASIDQKDDFFYDASSTSDNVLGIYYLGLFHSTNSYKGVLLSVNARTGKTILQTVVPNPFFVLEFDQQSNTIYGLAFDVQAQTAIVYQVNPTTFAQKAIGSFPKGLVPLDNGGAYDSTHQIMYYRCAKGLVKSLIGMSITTGKIVSTATWSKAVIYFTLEYDSVADRLVSLSQNVTGTGQYFLSVIDPLTANGKALSLTGFSSNAYDFIATTLSSSRREYYTVMSAKQQTLNVISLDSGLQLSAVNNWKYIPIDLTYVEWTS